MPGKEQKKSYPRKPSVSACLPVLSIQADDLRHPLRMFDRHVRTFSCVPSHPRSSPHIGTPPTASPEPPLLIVHHTWKLYPHAAAAVSVSCPSGGAVTLISRDILPVGARSEPGVDSRGRRAFRSPSGTFPADTDRPEMMIRAADGRGMAFYL